MLMDSGVLYFWYCINCVMYSCSLVTYIYQQYYHHIRKLVQIYSRLNVYTLGRSTRRVQVADHVMYSILKSET